MKKIKNFTIGGIQQKVYNLVLITILLVVAAYTAVILYQAGSLADLVEESSTLQKESIADISQTTMAGVLSESMGTSTRMEAYIADDLFRDLSGAVQMLADYASTIFAAPASFPFHSVSLPDPAADGIISVQLLTEAGVDLSDPVLLNRLGLIGNMSEMMSALYASADVNSCYIALPDGVMLLADDHAGSKYAADGSLISIPIRERPWYVGAVETGKLFFTDVTQDVFTGQIGIMCSVPVYQNGTLAAVVGADLFLDRMSDAIDASARDGAFTCIINDKGHVIFSPQIDGVFKVQPSSEAEDLRLSDNDVLAEFVTAALNGTTGLSVIEFSGQQYYVIGSPIETLGWTVISVVSREAADQPTVMMEDQYERIMESASSSFNSGLASSRKTILILLLIVFVLGTGSSLILSKRIVKPLEIITRNVRSLGGDKLRFEMQKEYRTGDEIEVLAESFANLSQRTLQYVDQVTKVTAEKERIVSELNMATAIQASQLPRLFPPFPNRPEFDIYASMMPAKEVGGDFYDFFMIDDDHIGFVMADVSGKGVPAALFMMVSRVLIKSRLQSGESPATALQNVNDQLCEGNDSDFFVTAWVAILEISTGKGIAANAGHEHPALRRANGNYELVTYRHSPAVAVMRETEFREHEFELHPGDSFFVYTDGVTEANNNRDELFGTDRMLRALNRDPEANPEEALNNVTNGIRDFVAEAEQFDDITMLCVRYNGPSAG